MGHLNSFAAVFAGVMVCGQLDARAAATVDIFRFHGDFKSATHFRVKREMQSHGRRVMTPEFAGQVSLPNDYRYLDPGARMNNPINPLHAIRPDESSLETLLASLQQFPIQEALKRGGVADERTAQQMIAAETWLEPSQVTFFSRTDDGKTTGSAWLVRGTEYFGEPKPLPAEKAGFELDRKKAWGLVDAPVFWEAGRAAQAKAGAIRDVIDQILFETYREIHAGRIDPKRAVILATAFDPARARLYERVYKMKAVQKTADGKTLFAIRLEDLARRIDFESAYEPLRLTRKLRPDWTIGNAMYFILEARRLRKQAFTLARPTIPGLLVEIRDFTTDFRPDIESLRAPLFTHRYESYYEPVIATNASTDLLQLKKAILGPELFFNQPNDRLPKFLEAWSQGKSPESDNGKSWEALLRENNAIELSLGSDHPTLLEAKSAAVHALHQIQKNLNDIGVVETILALRASKVRFAIGTPKNQAGPELRTLEYEALARYEWKLLDPERLHPDLRRIGQWGVIITVEQILRWERELVSANALIPLGTDQAEVRFAVEKYFSAH